MGQFANTLFGVLLGWTRSAAAALWGLVTNADADMWLQWLLDHWLSLTLMLCIGGMVIDGIVYIIRWQPYRVWRSFFHRMAAGESEEPLPEQPVMSRKWLHADGSVTLEDISEPLQPEPEEKLETPIRPVRRVARRTTPEQAYNQPYYPPQWHQTNEQGEQ